MTVNAGGSLVSYSGVLVLLTVGCLSACDPKERAELAPKAAPEPAKEAPLLVDGSSTVHLLSEAILDLYAAQLTLDIKLAVSGTGGGFKKFCAGQTQLNGASRPITSLEAKACEKNGIAYVELPVAYDGIAVVVPKSNDWLESLTTKELALLWSAQAEGQVSNWKQVRSSFPDKPVTLYGPDSDSGTFDFFNEAIVKETIGIRADYKNSKSDHELAGFVAKDDSSLGYFGLAYYRKYEKALNLVAIDDGNDENGKGAILPTPTTVGSGDYAPLSRPLFIYVDSKQLDRPSVEAFVRFYIRSARLVAPDVGYVGLGHDVLDLVENRLKARKVGSVFSGVHTVSGLTIGDLLQAEEVPVAGQARNGSK